MIVSLEHGVKPFNSPVEIKYHKDRTVNKIFTGQPYENGISTGSRSIL